MVSTPALHQLARSFAAYDKAWGALNFERLRDLWDVEETPIYIGEEYADPVVGWDQLDAHWSRVASRVVAAEVRSDLRMTIPFGQGYARVLVLSSWGILSTDVGAMLRGRSWVTALLAARSEGWRFVQYVEVPVYEHPSASASQR